jgi:TRAP-type C4-dicarboxylate transport system permease small subunit
MPGLAVESRFFPAARPTQIFNRGAFMSERRAGRTLQFILDAISAILFIVMFLMFIIEVVFRYVLNDPISWSIELIMVCFLVMLFWTASVGVPLSRHISFNIVYAALPPQGRRIFLVVGNLVGLGVLAASVPGVLDIGFFEQRESTPILHVPFSVFYLTFALFVISFCIRLVFVMVGLFRSGWQDRV